MSTSTGKKLPTNRRRWLEYVAAYRSECTNCKSMNTESRWCDWDCCKCVKPYYWNCLDCKFDSDKEQPIDGTN